MPNFLRVELVAPSRFSAKPPPPNTFLNFQPGPKTPGYISEEARLAPSKDINAKCGFQNDDKAKKQALSEARLGMKKMHNDNLAQKINDLDHHLTNKDQ